jgi:hypothetical protein
MLRMYHQESLEPPLLLVAATMAAASMPRRIKESVLNFMLQKE